MNKFYAIGSVVVGVLLILFSGYYGLALAGVFIDFSAYGDVGTAMIEGRPAIQGYVGGIIPTVTGVVGVVVFLNGTKSLKVA